MSMNTLKRPAILAVVVAATITIYQFLAPRPPVEVRPRKPRELAWEQRNAEFWSSLKYVRLRDENRLRDAIKSSLERSKVMQAIAAPEREAAANSLLTLFTAIAAETPEEYLRLIAPLRKLRPSLADDSVFLIDYKWRTGRPMPPDLDPRAALQLFWEGKPGATGRIIEASFADERGVAISQAERTPTGWKVLDNSERGADAWMILRSAGFVEATESVVPLDQEVNKAGRARLLQIELVVRTPDGTPTLILVELFWDSTGSRWLVNQVLRCTDRLTLWPL